MGILGCEGAPGAAVEALVPTAVELHDDLQEQLAEGYELRRRAEADRLLDAYEPGELLEHATMPTMLVDNGTFGIEAMFVVGDELFEYPFRARDGLGNGLGGPSPNMRRVHDGARGGPDAIRCSGCHFKGGPDGAGTQSQNAFLLGDGDSTESADERNAPHLLGLGPVEALAREMSADLQRQRDAAVERAATGHTVTVELHSKGVSFGSLVASAGGVDHRGLTGVDADLVIKPFGWKGHQPTIREMAEESFRLHLGIVSTATQQSVREGRLDPAIYGDGRWPDIDRDNIPIELDDGMLTTMAVYLAMLEAPVIRPPRQAKARQAFEEGRELFERVGCARCHVPALSLHNPVISVQPGSKIRIDVARDGDRPKVENADDSGYIVRLFSDLKRHDMGPALASRAEQGGVPRLEYLTRPLWGLADTAPYLHDGRAANTDAAIRLHGGDAADARALYSQLAKPQRASLNVFLMSLTREPGLLVP